MKNEATRKHSKHSRGRGSNQRTVSAPASVTPVADGSLIDRRVGRGAKNLRAALARRRAVPVDTSRPGSSATDRRAGGGATAARNTMARAPRANAMLEDSAKARPSRKSTRRSANHAKQGTELERKAAMKSQTPSARTRARR